MSIYRPLFVRNKSIYNLILSSNRLASPKRPLSTPPKVKQNVINEDEQEGPIRFLRSDASRWRAESSRIGKEPNEPRLWYEPYVILTSLTVFMLYFCVFREENDIDEEFSRTLYSRIEGLEEHQLRMSLDYNRQNGLETDAIIRRLQELEQLHKASQGGDEE